MGRVERYLCNPIRAVRCALAKRRRDKSEKEGTFRTFRPCLPSFRQTGVDVKELFVVNSHCRVGFYDWFLWKLSFRDQFHDRR